MDVGIVLRVLKEYESVIFIYMKQRFWKKIECQRYEKFNSIRERIIAGFVPNIIDL